MGSTLENFVNYWIEAKSSHIYPQYYKDVMPFVEKIKSLPNIDMSDKTRTPDGFKQLVDLMNSYQNYIRRFCDYNAEFTPVSVPNKSKCIDDLKALSKEITGLYFSDTLDFILLSTEIEMYNPFTDIKFNFGKFKIRMYAKTVTVEAIGNNTKKDGYYHPYVKGSKLCLGEYKDSYILFYNNMMYYDAWLEVKKCLTSYGGDELNGTKSGPEHAMNAWIGYQCEVCRNTAQPEDIVSCIKSKSFICRDCINTGTCTDEINGQYYLPHFISNCASCGKNASTVINDRCFSCRLG